MRAFLYLSAFSSRVSCFLPSFAFRSLALSPPASEVAFEAPAELDVVFVPEASLPFAIPRRIIFLAGTAGGGEELVDGGIDQVVTGLGLVVVSELFP